MLQQALRQLQYNLLDSRSGPASQIGKVQVTLGKSGLETEAGLFCPPLPAFWVLAEAF